MKPNLDNLRKQTGMNHNPTVHHDSSWEKQIRQRIEQPAPEQPHGGDGGKWFLGSVALVAIAVILL